MAAGKASRSPRAAWKETRGEVLNRGRRSVALDPKKPGALDAALRLIAEADALIEGVRAGVLERLGPAVCHARNPRLVSGRITDWGGTGRLRGRPGTTSRASRSRARRRRAMMRSGPASARWAASVRRVRRRRWRRLPRRGWSDSGA
jgi:crotonobetainyl-CoA:carnitine CoA-transferase CaiB-like acyl-CoA transferase